MASGRSCDLHLKPASRVYRFTHGAATRRRLVNSDSAQPLSLRASPLTMIHATPEMPSPPQINPTGPFPHRRCQLWRAGGGGHQHVPLTRPPDTQERQHTFRIKLEARCRPGPARGARRGSSPPAAGSICNPGCFKGVP